MGRTKTTSLIKCRMTLRTIRSSATDGRLLLPCPQYCYNAITNIGRELEEIIALDFFVCKNGYSSTRKEDCGDGTERKREKMTEVLYPELKDETYIFEQKNKKAERIKRSKSKRKNKLQKPSPEKHSLFDDPEFLQMVALSRLFRTY